MKPVSIIICLIALFSTPLKAGHPVYLVHGFGSAPVFMMTIERHLSRAGLHTRNFGYPSLSRDIPVCAKELIETIRKNGDDSISFVTHSMGALVVRSVLEQAAGDSTFPAIGRVVMIAPANQGAEIADFFARSKILCHVLGPNLSNLRTDSSSPANNLFIPQNIEIGIIVGARFARTGYNPLITGDNDGYLTPSRTRLGTEKQLVMVPASHSMIIHNKRVMKLVLNFLRTGWFDEKVEVEV